MARRYSIAAAKDHLPEVVRVAESGEPVTITRHGRPVAVLLAATEYDKLTTPRRDFWSALQDFRRTFDAERDGLGPEFFDGLRDPSPGRDVDLDA